MQKLLDTFEVFHLSNCLTPNQNDGWPKSGFSDV